MYIGFIIAFIFIFIAGITNNENADSLLAGYNTMSDEKKKKVDFKGVVKKLKLTMYTAAVFLVLTNILTFFTDNKKIIITSYLNIIAVACIYWLIGSKKFDTNQYKTWEKVLQKSIVILLIMGTVFLNYILWTTPLDELNINKNEF